jgi:hypothetical protein
MLSLPLKIAHNVSYELGATFRDFDLTAGHRNAPFGRVPNFGEEIP